MGYVIRLSRDPAIPTFYADDLGDYYAASFERRAIHYPTRLAAEKANRENKLEGAVQRCRCEP